MSKVAKINGIVNGKRISTQKLLQEIYKKLDEGYTEFEVLGCGQHDIGGPLWDKDGKPLKFKVTNPGQRAGSMAMTGTQIVIEGPAPADVGWLNAGAEIILKGDGGDTTAHCAATGKIYVAGRVGTRSGALMKHDPKFPPPEFWVLKNTGSFSFEFMGGGIAVVCGYDCDEYDSVLGKRSCVGMVGGTVYVRGPVKDLSDDVWLMDLNDADRDFLSKGVKEFLSKIDRLDLYEELTDFSQWQKIVSKSYEERQLKLLIPIKDFREHKWVEGGIFGDLINEDLYVADFVEHGDLRLKYPEWKNASYSAPCEYNCPISIPTQKRIALLREGKIKEALELILDYSPFPASVCGQVCPNLCMDVCSRKHIDTPVRIGELGLLSKSVGFDRKPAQEKEKKVAIIGAGASGLTAAWHLRLMGYKVDIFEKDSVIGGKLKQVIPEDRLNQEILEDEIRRILELGVNVKTNTEVDKKLFEKLTKDYDAVIIAVGAHDPLILPVEGRERLVKGLDFLKAVNKGEKPKIGKKVVVIGAGNAGMDVVLTAYKLGAEEVVALDIQKPAAFEKEIEHAKRLGAKILWPAYTEKIDEKGVYLKDGRFIEADMVIVSIGDRPDFSFLPKEYFDEKGKIKLNDFLQTVTNEKVFVAGDAIKLGLFTHAIGDGRKTAINVDRLLSDKPLDDFKKAPMIPQDRVKKEYYPAFNTMAVMEKEPEFEKDRCMSCGFCRDCEMCKDACPEQAITRIQIDENSFEYFSDPNKCIGCGICEGVCPCGIWTMIDNIEKYMEA